MEKKNIIIGFWGNMIKEKFRCDYCGRFISIKDLEEGKAHTYMITPDSYFTKEEYETICKNCRQKLKR